MVDAVVELEKYLCSNASLNKIRVNREESHPNAYGHKVIADNLEKKSLATMR